VGILGYLIDKSVDKSAEPDKPQGRGA
jgi:hypothetical protein